MEKTLKIKTRKQLRDWLLKNHNIEKAVWVKAILGKPKSDTDLSYINIVEECLCFGWVDGKHKGSLIRLTPRNPKSHWTQLNLFRCKRLIKLGLMTKAGKSIIPKQSFRINSDLKKLLSKDKQLAKNFNSFPKLYQIIRLDSIQRYEKELPDVYEKAIANFIKQTKAGKMYGQWNDYGRLK